MHSWVSCVYVLKSTGRTVNSKPLPGALKTQLYPQYFPKKSPRLSLANDSDKLLERYICTLPKEPNQPWYEMTDAYGSSLWDIDPVCQVAAICDNDTVVLDGARGATIEWSRFDCIWYSTGPSWKRLICSLVLRFGSAFLSFGIFLGSLGIIALIIGQVGNNSIGNSFKVSFYYLLGFSALFLGIWFATVLFTPLLVRTALAGKIEDVQGAFFGVEGYLNTTTVERLIFGGSFGRFKWSTNGSLLSRSRINEHKERVGIDPCVDVDTRKIVDTAKVARPGEMRVSNDLVFCCR